MNGAGLSEIGPPPGRAHSGSYIRSSDTIAMQAETVREATMRILFVTMGLILTLSPYPQKVTDQNPLVGNWKLISSQAVYDNNAEPQDVPGPHPKGYLILTPEGRMMTVATSTGRKPGPSDAERAELWKTMIAYSGKYRIEG